MHKVCRNNSTISSIADLTGKITNTGNIHNIGMATDKIDWCLVTDGGNIWRYGQMFPKPTCATVYNLSNIKCCWLANTL